jgi:hypothetical protein
MMGDVVELHPTAPDGGPPFPKPIGQAPRDGNGRLFLDGPEHDAWQRAYDVWWPALCKRREWEANQAAKARAAARKAAPHPNWLNRRSTCHVATVGPTVPTVIPAFAKTARKPRPPAVAHHGAWEGDPRRCGAPVVAYDVTGRRAVGHLYGACVHHLETAMAADLTREWWWADARPVAGDVEAELALAALNGGRIR